MINSLNLVRSGFYFSENPDRTAKMLLNIGPVRIFFIFQKSGLKYGPARIIRTRTGPKISVRATMIQNDVLPVFGRSHAFLLLQSDAELPCVRIGSCVAVLNIICARARLILGQSGLHGRRRSIRPCEQRTEIWAQTVHLMDDFGRWTKIII